MMNNNLVLQNYSNLISVSSFMAIPSRTAESATASSPPTASCPSSSLPLAHVTVLLEPVQATLLQGRLAGPDHGPIVDHSQRLVVFEVNCLLSEIVSLNQKECDRHDRVIVSKA